MSEEVSDVKEFRPIAPKKRKQSWSASVDDLEADCRPQSKVGILPTHTSFTIGANVEFLAI